MFGSEGAFSVQNHGAILCYFGKAVAVLINIIDPFEAIVLGGGLGNLDAIY
ncbi:MAG: hypothetical protein IPO62_00010 [Saprospiraceae bacterium]|nr:hypothetical protein [Saprospiraceae bacterium]